ncbi:MAG: class I SAM-dependent methyltransferase [Candidatus Eremiobacteraeota bacterium]|nr:class I SAM-dependent methyltransferase [Candidatus Eremiobacteraeota bacterium]
MTQLPCRFCARPLEFVVVDLGSSPPSNALLSADALDRPETFFPLRVYRCRACGLVQLPQYQTPETTFSQYPYFSSFSSLWLQHVERYAAGAVQRFGLGERSRVIEIASNDGHLLRRFQAAGIPVLGIEPAKNVAAAAERAGVPTITDFFGSRLARTLAAEGLRADLLVANNVLAHVPELNDFVAGVREALQPNGVATFEFPHLLQLLERVEYDTIYHEHLSYLSLGVVQRIFARHGLTLFDVEELTTHGGSLRVFAQRQEHDRPPGAALGRILDSESRAGLEDDAIYLTFQRRVQENRQHFRQILSAAAAQGQSVAGYGAPAKATTVLNYCGVGTELIAYTVDKNPYKQGKFIPGVRLPIYAPEKLLETKPDVVVIFPWNIKDEVTTQMGVVHEWGGRFVVPISSAIAA